MIHYMTYSRFGQTLPCLLEGSLAYSKVMLAHARAGVPGGEEYREAREECDRYKEDLIMRFGDISPGIASN